MKKYQLPLFILSPVLFGLIYGSLVLTPVIGPILIIVSPVLLLLYWFWVGRRFSDRVKSPLSAILMAHSLGFVSLLLYYWQFILLNSNQRSLWLSGLSQEFSAPLAFLTVKIGTLFEPLPDTITQVSLNVMQVAGLLLMIIVFTIGYFTGKKKQRRSLVDKIRAK